MGTQPSPQLSYGVPEFFEFLRRFNCRESFMPLKTLFGDHAALTEYVERTTDQMLIEFISATWGWAQHRRCRSCSP
eukprot:6183671-Prorocentrum_lima.AAC.1